MRIRTRLFVEDDLDIGALVAPDQGQTHQLLHVLRVRAGEFVELFNGRDGSFRAEIIDLGKRHLSLQVHEKLAAQHHMPDLWLAFAPLKKARVDYVAQKAVECGYGRLCPVLTKRTQAEKFSRERFHANMVEAAEQCAINIIPELDEPVDLQKFFQQLPKDRQVFMGDESGQGDPAWDVLGRHEPGLPSVILIGPEGGFDDKELSWLRDLPQVHPMGLGPRILRADTAMVVAAALWQARLGDLSNAPRFQALGPND